jgi:di- and tripeptidase
LSIEESLSQSGVERIPLSNSYWIGDDIPCMTFGLRGVIHATVEVSKRRTGFAHEKFRDSSSLSNRLRATYQMCIRACTVRVYHSLCPQLERRIVDLFEILYIGGVVHEPLTDMARVLASLVDQCGKVSLPGFYDNVRSLEPDEGAIYDEIIRRCEGFVDYRC